MPSPHPYIHTAVVLYDIENPVEMMYGNGVFTIIAPNADGDLGVRTSPDVDMFANPLKLKASGNVLKVVDTEKDWE